MKLYRATSKKDEYGIPRNSCWTPDIETARAYQDNPGYGGQYLREIDADGEILDITAGLHVLAEALGYNDPRETATVWLSDNGWRYPWEESGDVARRLRRSGYHWLRYEDDFPDGAITMMRII